jgi:ribosomal-protein-alanine N-acetyltransferase
MKLVAQGFCIAPMTEHDLLEVVEIEEACGLSRWGWDAYHDELEQGEASLMLVARESEAERRGNDASATSVFGFIASRLGAGELHINNVAVRHSFRRQGIGADLLEAALRVGKQRGARSAWLEVRAGNTNAKSLYERCGFVVVGRRPAYYRAPTEDALIMSARLFEEA